MPLTMFLVSNTNENRCSMAIGYDEKHTTIFNVNAYQKLSRTPERVKENKKKQLDKLNEALTQALKENNLAQAETYRDEIINVEDEADSQKLKNVVNDFYEFLPEECQEALYDYYRAAKDVIWTLNSTNHRQIRKALVRLTEAMFQQVQIDVYALRFVRVMNFPLPSFENTGMRSHDTMEMTHDRESYILTTAMCIISKVMVPVWGDYCAAMSCIGMPTVKNDFFCLSIIAPAYRKSSLADHYQRLFDYCLVFIEKAFAENLYRASTGKDKVKNRDDNEYVTSKNSNDRDMFELLIFGFAIVKRMVMFDLWTSVLKGEDRQPNLMIYISTRIGPFTITTLKQINESSKLSPRFDVAEPSTTMDDNNVTHLENVSRVSRVSFDTAIIVEEGTKLAIRRALAVYGIDEAQFDEACAFYAKHPITPSILSNAVVSIVLSPMLGISKNMGYLSAEAFNMGCVFTQFVLSRYGVGFDQLLVLLTCGDDGLNQANGMVPTKIAIRNSYKHVQLYHDVVANFPHTCEQVLIVEEMVGGRRKKKKRPEKFTVKQQIDRICEWLYANDHHVNLWPGFWKRVSYLTPQPQGSVFEYKEDVMEMFYRFLLEFCPHTKQIKK